jgi:hypothetical protein
MTKLCYVPKEFSADHLRIIGNANQIIERYQKDGYRLTLRSLYYKFVGGGLFKENNEKMYNLLQNVINAGRLAGLVDWEAIEDNLRYLQGSAFVSGPHEAIRAARDKLRLDLWADQDWQPEVWCEKDAMIGVVEGICDDLRVNFFACRGYTSQSAMYRAGQRMARYIEQGKRPIIFHFGDHDPSGIDMTRDNEERLAMFAGTPIQFVRLGLNMTEIERYNPPPNYAKPSDTRYRDYCRQFDTEECWEIDALEPRVISNMIESAVLRLRDETKWEAALAREAEDIDKLDRIMEEQGWIDGQE